MQLAIKTWSTHRSGRNSIDHRARAIAHTREGLERDGKFYEFDFILGHVKSIYKRLLYPEVWQGLADPDREFKSNMLKNYRTIIMCLCLVDCGAGRGSC